MIEKCNSFIDDAEKMRDFLALTKDEFLVSYSYLSEDEYIDTLRDVLITMSEVFKHIAENCL